MYRGKSTKGAFHGHNNQLLHLLGCSARIATSDHSTLNLEGGVLTLAEVDKGVDTSKEYNGKKEANY